MRVTTEQLASRLKALAPLYTVFGDEPLLAIEAADRIRARAREDGISEREILTAEQHFDWAQLRVTGQSQSLFSARRLLELRIPGGKPGVEGAKALEQFAEKLPLDTTTLIQLPGLDWRAQKSAWFQALDKAGVVVEAGAVSRAALPRWIGERLAMQGQQADDETLNFIADRVEGNLLAAYQEVQKLALIFPPGRLGFEQARSAVLDVSRFDVSQLGPAVTAGSAVQMARILDGLRGEGAAPPLVLWAMAEEIRALGRVLAGVAAGRPLPQLWREARVWGTAHQSLVQRNLKRFTAAQIEDALRHAASIDHIVKGLAKGDEWDELLQLGMRFARPAASK